MTVLSPSDWLKQPDALIVAQGIDTQPRLLSNLLDSLSCFHALSIEPGVDSRSRGCHAILKETRHHGSSPVILIRPDQIHAGKCIVIYVLIMRQLPLPIRNQQTIA